MRFKSRHWWLLSLLLFAAAYLVWNYAEKVSASRRGHAPANTPAVPAVVSQPTAPALTQIAQAPKSSKTNYRLSNTKATEKDLLRSTHAIILRNALIDTDRPLKLNIPAHLKAKGAPGSYIVQAEGALDQRFYDRLKKDGVTYVCYVPNNAALVQATPDQAREMASDAEFQAVIPNEPYYKLATALLPSAVAQDQPLSEAVNVTALPGQRNAALAALQGLGAQLMGEDNGPFGTTLSVMVPPEKLVAVAQLPLAQEVETYAPRRTLNDLSRVIMNISSNTFYTNANYMHLTGSNVTVNMNDTGVDSTHPDFRGSGGIRVEGLATALTDQASGHGTHVAGTIMGNGSMSSNVTTIVPGETSLGVGFQGKATNAYLFVQQLGLLTGATIDDAFQFGGSLLSDGELQSNASLSLGPTNLISNNSWGYDGINSYDMHAASFDQATRDAQPFKQGEQPMLFVFAAGPEGNGNVYGEGGQEGSILSPATAKNVITVGALDEARFITNGVTFDGLSTNDIFFPWTDNDQFVAWFSSCGNVGAGTEGVFGRFKPDVVAPGVFTISCRAANYVDPTNADEITTYPYPNQLVLPGQTNDYSLAIPPDTAELVIYITPNANSPVPFPNLNILADPKSPPVDVVSSDNFVVLSSQLTATNWYFGVMSQTNQQQPVAYDLTMYLFETNDLGVPTTNTSGYYTVISNLNSILKPYYVYQYGTSQAAGAVSGMLALMQEFLQSHPQLGLTNPSPALLKAMLINGSRSAEEQYDFNTQPLGPNEQGWGLPNLTNTVPVGLGTGTNSMLLVDQSTNDALATGESQSFTFATTDPNATNFPVRVSLVWTDPPGDPAAGIALVNNLDLVVTDGSGTNIWLGNDFFSGDIFSEVNTGDLPDVINNVQNVYIGGFTPFKFPLTVTVLGMRVNVNAVTRETNQITQDYALVISSDDTALTAPLTISASNTPTFTPPPNLAALLGPTFTNAAGAPLLSPPLMTFARSNYALVTYLSNGSNYLHQRVGANEPNLYANGPLYNNVDTNGNVFQWHFFVYTNDQFIGTNQATNFMVTTFMPPDLATQISPRTNGADLDLYVSTNPGLTNLDPNVFAAMTTNDMSLSRGGNEAVIYTNSQANEVYYIGVKSEDQQAADFGIYAVAQQPPFSVLNTDGSITGTAGPTPIPDSLSGPPAILHVYLGPSPLSPQLTLRKVTATLSISADNPSDLYGTLAHNGVQDILNNYSGPPGGFTNTYNDLGDNSTPGSVNSDGPGSLTSFINTSGLGIWTLTESDNAILQSGQVNSISITAYPQPPVGVAFPITICGQQWFDDFVVVPDDATNIVISVSFVSGTDDVGIFITNTDNVGFDDYGVHPISAPGGYLTYSITNKPPLDGGVWYYGIYNYGTGISNCDTLDVEVSFGLSQVPNLVQTYTNNTMVPLPTDATTNASQICISNGQQLLDLSVGVRLTDPNLDDLVLQLTSPQGTSLVLFENRGGVLASNLGLSLVNSNSTDYIYTTFTEDTNLTSEPIKFAPPPYATPVVFTLTNIYAGSFDAFTNKEDSYTNGGTITSNAAGIYTNGQHVAGWFVETNLLVTNYVLSNMVTIVVTNSGTNSFTNSITNQVYVLVTNQYFNEISVMTDPGVTYDGTNLSVTNINGTNTLGSNYLALASGRLSQTFTTVPGTAYELVYYARSPGLTDWWPADDNTVDIVGTNNATIPESDVTFDVGEVDRAFTFSGVTTNANQTKGNEVDFGTNTANFGTNNFTIDFWIKLTNTSSQYGVLEKRPICDSTSNMWSIRSKSGQLGMEVSSDNNVYYSGFTAQKAVNDEIFHHAAFVREGLVSSIYIDGFLNNSITNVGIANIANDSMFRAGQSACSGGPDGTLPLVGEIDELNLWQRALSPGEIHAIYQAGSLGKYNTNSIYPNFQVAFDGVFTNDVVIPNFAETNWQLYTNSFIATSNQTTIELIGHPLGVLLDDIELIQLPYTNYNNYYLPEEPLAPLIGQNPQGCWTLSVWDTRTDSALPDNGALLSWTLQLTTSSTNVNLIVLSDGVPYCTSNLNANGGIMWFAVDVPLTANDETNFLFNATGPMNLYFNQDALPTGALPGDVTLVSITNAGGGSGSRTLSTLGAPPPLQPGQRYFLGVQNTSSAAENFCIEVSSDVGHNTNILSLTNGFPLDPIVTNNSPNFYSFVVPTNAELVTFQLLNLSGGEADLYASDGLPVPGPSNFDYESRNKATNDQFIAVTTNSEPVPLPTATTNNLRPETPTTWYLSVYNPGTNPVSYTILATVVTNGPNGSHGAMDIINLNAQSNYTYYETNAPGAPPGFPTSLMYSFTIPRTSLGQVEFVVTNISTNGNLQLLVGEGVFPTPEDSYSGSFNAGNSNQLVVIETNSELPNLSNTWYLAVVNTSPTNVKYSITAIVTNGALNNSLTWDGGVGSTWNLSEADWRPPSGPPDTTYNDADAVLFDNTLTSGRNIITIPATVEPSGITFNNSTTNTYRFIGSGGIGGTNRFSLLNNGTVILDDGANTFTGLITINNGELLIGDADANGSITANVDINSPGTLAFNRTDNLTYPGALSGNGTLFKANTDILTLAGDDTNFDGTADIVQGTLQFGAPNALGKGSNAFIHIFSGGTLDLNSFSGANFVTVSGAGVNSNGAIVNNGASAAVPGLASITMTGNTTVGGSHRWDLDGPLSTGSQPYNLTKVGTNIIGLVNSTVDPALANIDVEGTLDYQGTTDSLGNPIDVLTLETNATLEFDDATNGLNKVIVFKAGSTNLNAAGTNSILGPVTLSTNGAGEPGTVTFDIGGTSQLISTTISGPGNLIVTGGQPLYLAASNAYIGFTLVTTGTVFLVNAGSIGLSTNVSGASNATIDVTGRADMTYTAPINQTLQGFGRINGSLRVAPGGAVAVGPSNATGVLTVSSNVSLAGTVAFKVNNVPGGTNDVLVSLGTSIAYGGTLAVSNMSAIQYTNGQRFQLFSDPFRIYSGAFATIMPFQPAAGLYWNTNLLDVNGTISVTNLPVAPALIWDGGAGANWNFTEADWRPFSGPPDTIFSDADPVTFDDSLTTGRNTIDITTNVQPGNMTFNNSVTNTYTFVGPGSISGITGMNLNGNGTVILDNSGGNTFIGLINIANGTLQIGRNDANGSIIASVTNTAPGKLIFDRTDNLTYLGNLSGNGTLIQNDSDILTLAGQNANLHGLVEILQGTLRLGANNALGSGSNAPIYINSGATLDLNSVAGTNFVTVAGAGVGNNGAIVNNGFNPAMPGLSYITMTNDTTLGGLQNWDLGSQGIFNSVIQPTNNSFLSTGGHPYNLTKVGPNVIGLVSSAIDPALANIDVKAGTLAYEGTTDSLGNPANVLTVETGATLELNSATNALNKAIVFNDGSTNFNAGGSNAIIGPVTLSTNSAGEPGTVTFDMAGPVGAQQSVSSVIGGPGNLIVTGGQDLFLSANNTYTGFTLVSTATVYLVAGGSIGLSPTVTVLSNSTIDSVLRADLTYTVPSGQTLQGFGSIDGFLRVSLGGTIAPGVSNATGLFTVSSNVTLSGTTLLKIDATAGGNDMLASTGGSITYGGTLQISNAAAFTPGQSFQLFNAAYGYAGSFASLVPATPGVGLHWNTNLLAVNGTLSIVANMPVITSFSLSRTNFMFTITNGIPLGQFIILTSTNLAQPWAPFATNTFNSAGDFNFIEPFSPTNQQQFFTIEEP